MAQVLLGEVSPALDDARASLRHGGRTRRLLVNAACIHARAAVQRQTSPRPSPLREGGRPLPTGSLAQQLILRDRADAAHEFERLQEEAVNLLREAVESVPVAARPTFGAEHSE